MEIAEFEDRTSRVCRLNHPVKEIRVARQQAGNKGGARTVVDLHWRSVLNDVSVIHHCNSVAHGERFLLVMRYKDRCNAHSINDLFQLGTHFNAQLAIKRSQRLIQ